MDAPLVSAARMGDEQAFLALYEQHAGRVRRVVRGWISDPDVVDDLCQEVWMRALQGLARFRGEAGFGTWLHTIARNVVTSRGRLDRRRTELLRESWHPPTSSRPEPVELRISLRSAVSSLPEGMRKVLWLHDVEGWTHMEIGTALGVAEGTSKSQLFKARVRLRDALRDTEAEGARQPA
jgi:RNA polymerase sigma-70 factor (ECF subfamily)